MSWWWWWQIILKANKESLVQWISSIVSSVAYRSHSCSTSVYYTLVEHFHWKLLCCLAMKFIMLTLVLQVVSFFDVFLTCLSNPYRNMWNNYAAEVNISFGKTANSSVWLKNKTNLISDCFEAIVETYHKRSTWEIITKFTKEKQECSIFIHSDYKCLEIKQFLSSWSSVILKKNPSIILKKNRELFNDTTCNIIHSVWMF